MSALLDELPVTVPSDWLDELDDDEQHAYCCDPDRALCGTDLTGWRDIPDAEVDDGDYCTPCFLREMTQRTCGAPLCRLRRWWRSR